jgi:hypothetical protein
MLMQYILSAFVYTMLPFSTEEDISAHIPQIHYSILEITSALLKVFFNFVLPERHLTNKPSIV